MRNNKFLPPNMEMPCTAWHAYPPLASAAFSAVSVTLPCRRVQLTHTGHLCHMDKMDLVFGWKPTP